MSNPLSSTVVQVQSDILLSEVCVLKKNKIKQLTKQNKQNKNKNKTKNELQIKTH
jgi:ankyrin repeat protein